MPGAPESGPFKSRMDAFRRGLRELGYVDGQHLTLEVRWVGDDDSAAKRLAVELVRMPVDIIVTAGTPLALVVKKTTATIPIVVAAAGDFVGVGLVTDLARPGGNLTGTSDLTAALSGKRLELIGEIVPRVSHVAVLWNAANPGAARTLRETQDAARTLGLVVVAVEARTQADLALAFERASEAGVGAIVIIQDPFTVAHRSEIVTLAARRAMPAIYGSAAFVQDGGLIAYGADIPDLYRRAASFVDKILKGAHPKDLPIEQPTKFELVINLKTAKALGLTIPQSLLLRTDQAIE